MGSFSPYQLLVSVSVNALAYLKKKLTTAYNLQKANWVIKNLASVNSQTPRLLRYLIRPVSKSVNAHSWDSGAQVSMTDEEADQVLDLFSKVDIPRD